MSAPNEAHVSYSLSCIRTKTHTSLITVILPTTASMIVSVASNSDPLSHSTPIASKILGFVASRQKSYFRRDHWNWLDVTTGSEPPKICGRVGIPFRIPAPTHTRTIVFKGQFAVKVSDVAWINGLEVPGRRRADV
jgi:hypothetical protein